MAEPHWKPAILQASTIGAGLTLSMLALGTAFAQTTAPAETPAADAPAAAPAADAAGAADAADGAEAAGAASAAAEGGTAEGAAGSAPAVGTADTAAPAPADAAAVEGAGDPAPAETEADTVAAADAEATPDEGQTHGQAGAAQAAAALAAGEDDEPRILEAAPTDAYRVWVNDPAHFAAVTQQFVIDAQQARVLGVIDAGFLPNPVVADDGSMFAHASTVYSRIARGERTDYVEVFDPVTFQPTADIELTDDPRFLVGTYPWLTALTPDNKNLLFYQFSPSPAVGVVDLEAKTYNGLIEVPDCYHIFPTAPDTFFMHCREGSLAKVTFGGEGEPQISQTAVFHAEDEYLINHPAYSPKAGRLVWPTYTGKIYQIDFTSGDAVFREPIEALTEEERGQDWRPGGWQQVAYHRKSDRIFLLVDQRDQWRHKTSSRRVVVLDAGTGERVAKFDMGRGIDSINVSQNDDALLYALSTGEKTLYIHDAESGEELRSVNQLGHGPQVITVADMEE